MLSYMYVEFSTEQSAIDAQSYLNGYTLDKNHVFKTNFFQDFDTYHDLNLNEKIDEPAPYNDPVMMAKLCFFQSIYLINSF